MTYFSVYDRAAAIQACLEYGNWGALSSLYRTALRRHRCSARPTKTSSLPAAAEAEDEEGKAAFRDPISGGQKGVTVSPSETLSGGEAVRGGEDPSKQRSGASEEELSTSVFCCWTQVGTTVDELECFILQCQTETQYIGTLLQTFTQFQSVLREDIPEIDGDGKEDGQNPRNGQSMGSHFVLSRCARVFLISFFLFLFPSSDSSLLPSAAVPPSSVAEVFERASLPEQLAEIVFEWQTSVQVRLTAVLSGPITQLQFAFREQADLLSLVSA